MLRYLLLQDNNSNKQTIYEQFSDAYTRCIKKTWNTVITYFWQEIFLYSMEVSHSSPWTPEQNNITEGYVYGIIGTLYGTFENLYT